MKKFGKELWDILSEVFGRSLDHIREGWRYRAEKARLWKEHRELDGIQPHDQEMQSFLEHRYADLDEDSYGLRLMETRRIRREAAKYGVEMPVAKKGAFYGMVDWDVDDPYFLTDEGMQTVAAAIRAVRKERRDELAFKFGIFVGGLGALTGLLSVFMK